MRRILVGLAALAALGGCVTHAMPQEPGDACNMFHTQGGWWRSVRNAERRWGAPPALQLAIIRQESGFHYNIQPPRTRILWILPGPHVSSAHGYAQALNSAWEQYKRASGNGGADRHNFNDAVDFIAWYTSISHDRLGISYADARDQYLAYHEGHGGYSRGAYRGNAALMASAERVQSYRNAYQAQLNRCASSLDHGWWPF